MMSSQEATQVNEQAVVRRPSGMRSFIVIFLLLHIPLFIYPVLRLTSWLELSALTTGLILVPLASSQVVSRWGLRNVKNRYGRLIRLAADFWFGMSPVLLMILMVFEVVTIAGFMDRYSAALAVLLLTALVSFAGLFLAVHPVVERIEFAVDKLRSPLRFVQITDVHIGSRSPRFLDNVVARIRELNPDFLCITGDFIDATGVTEEEMSALTQLECPIYFSIGNHERYEDFENILARLGRLGVNVLRTQSIFHRDDVQVIGIDDRDDALQVERELSKVEVDEDAFSLLLYHRPRGLEAAQKAGIDLMLSGHTHGGQIFPFNFVVGRVFDRMVGMHRLGESRLYVSQGTGTWGPIMRVGTRSEITLFELSNRS